MRPVLPGDVDAAVRVLLARPPHQWPDKMDEMLARAHLADRYRKRLGRPHLQFGNGSLMAAARAEAAAAGRRWGDGPWCEAMAAVLAGLDRWRGRDCGGSPKRQRAL